MIGDVLTWLGLIPIAFVIAAGVAVLLEGRK